MLRYSKRHQAMAIGLASLAGFVDAIGFLELDGLFVSFMSGNSTRMAVGAPTLNRGFFIAASLIAAFLAGVVSGALLGRRAGGWRKPAVLGLITTLVMLASILTSVGLQGASITVIMACAMGAANNVFQREGEVTIGVTYMTGTLVKIGQKLADALAGGPITALFPYVLPWHAEPVASGLSASPMSYFRHGLVGD